MDVCDLGESPFEGSGEVVVDVGEVGDDTDLVAIAAGSALALGWKKECGTYVKRAMISLSSIVPKMVRSEILKPLAWRMGRTAPDSAGSMYLKPCHAVAVGPVSASPSPTTQHTTRSGLSMTAPKAALSA